jgi:UDP-2-acetamido-3-amino-2,3-dideoxy-glucuronate N-acetyltransferase
MEAFFIHPTALVDPPVKIGPETKIWHFCHVMAGAEIGARCILGQNVFVAANVKIGNGVKIQNNVSVYEGVICEDDVFIGPSAVFTNIRNPRSAVVRKGEYVQTYVSLGVSIGANATIVCGVRLGRYGFVGAGAVVTKDVPPYGLVVGNPARQIGWVSEFGHRLEFDATGNATCPESGQRYRKTEGGVKRAG